MAFRQTWDSFTAGCGSVKTVISRLVNLWHPSQVNSGNTKKYFENSSSDIDLGKGLQEAAERVAREFDFAGEEVRRAVQGFIQQMIDGLRTPGSTIAQLPSYITQIPTGLEKGTYLAVDLGGTNIRVCSVSLSGDGTYSIIQAKNVIPIDLMTGKSSKGLFSFVAKRVELFLKSHYPQSLNGKVKAASASQFSLGFTFSHAVEQLDINRGTLIRWSKGFDINGVVGQDICALLQDEFNELHLPVQVTALINDTVGTLMARAYASPSSAHTVLGAVFGTGTNGAYTEKRSKITKLSFNSEGGTVDSSELNDFMIVNTEWGNFDQKLEFLPNTSYDRATDAGTVNPGFELFEKRISGMYLGEILRLVILALVNNPRIPIFSKSSIPKTSQLYVKWGLDSEFMSLLEGDDGEQLRETRAQIAKWMDIDATYEDAKALKTISHAIGKRSARLSAVALGAVILQTDCLRGCEKGAKVDIGVDGSLIELYPGFVQEMRGALRDIHDIGTEGEGKITIVISKDGSGVGAALTAHVAAVALRESKLGQS